MRLLSNSWTRLWLVLAALLAMAPLWAADTLPLVDLPQHLHLISVLHRLQDSSTLYPEWFRARGELTPYLGYYWSVSLLNWLVPVETANRIFLSVYAAALPLSLAFLLASLGRPQWPAVLAVPFVYGDSFAWGFINYCSALPLVILSVALFIRTLRAPASSRAGKGWAVGLAASSVLTLLFHVQAYAFLLAALPLVALVWARPGGLRPSISACLALLPSALLMALWVGLRLDSPATVEVGAPWKAWGPLLSPQNLAFKSVQQNWEELPKVLANQLRDGSDRLALATTGVVWIAAWLTTLAAAGRGPQRRSVRELGTLLLLAAVALALYFALPFDIRGYMYYLNTRYAHLVALFAVCAVPAVSPRAERWLGLLGVASALLCAVQLGRGYRTFDAEAEPLRQLARQAPARARIVGLVFDPQSRVVRHPVYLHAAATVARESGGITNFSFALTPHSPVAYAKTPPPTFPSEWRPDGFDAARMGSAYDLFLIRGASAERLVGTLLPADLVTVAGDRGFTLLRHR